MATINKIQIPELDPIEGYLDDSDEFVVFDNRQIGQSKARKVSYRDIKTNLVNPDSIINGINYTIRDQDTLILSYREMLNTATEDKNGLMSNNDKKTLNQLTSIDINEISNSFNSKVGSVEIPYNINRIQGGRGISTEIEQNNNENILKITSTDIENNKLQILDANTSNYFPVDYLESGEGITLSKNDYSSSNNENNVFKIDLDIDYLQQQGIIVNSTIKADIENQEKSFSKIIAGNNINFSENINGELIISSLNESIDPEPIPQIIIKNTSVYTCNTESFNENKIINTDEILEEGDLFTVYFKEGYNTGNKNVTLTFGETTKNVIYNNNNFNSSLINYYATFVNEENYFVLLYSDTIIEKEININNEQLVELFDENNKIKNSLLPEKSDEDIIKTTYPIGEVIGNQSTSGEINIALNEYKREINNLITIRFSNVINTPAFLNINNTGSYPIVYQNNTNFDSRLITTQSVVTFFVTDDSYILLSTSSVINNIPSFEINNDNNIITNVSQTNLGNYSLINSNILNNNRISSNFLPSNLITISDLNNYPTRSEVENLIPTVTIPTIQGDSLIRVNNENDTINIGLNLPSSESASNLYLNGTGQWTTVNNLNSNLFNYIIDMFIPVGSYYETSDADFHPGQEEQGRRSGGWISETEKMAYDSIEWKLVKTYTLTNDDNSTTTVYKWHKQGIIGAG